MCYIIILLIKNKKQEKDKIIMLIIPVKMNIPLKNKKKMIK